MNEESILNEVKAVYINLSKETKEFISIDEYRKGTISAFKKQGSWIVCLFDEYYPFSKTPSLLEALKALVEIVSFNCKEDERFLEFKNLILCLHKDSINLENSIVNGKECFFNFSDNSDSFIGAGNVQKQKKLTETIYR